MVDAVLQRLQAQQTKEALAECWSEIHGWAWTLWDESQGGGENAGEFKTIDDCFVYAIDRDSDQPDGIAATLRERVLRVVRGAPIITLDEMVAELLALVWRVDEPWPDFDRIYPAYLARIHSLCAERVSPPFPIAGVRNRDRTADGSIISPESIWSGEGVSIELVAASRADVDPHFRWPAGLGSPPEILLYARLRGRMSPRSFARTESDLTAVLRTLIRSCQSTLGFNLQEVPAGTTFEITEGRTAAEAYFGDPSAVFRGPMAVAQSLDDVRLHWDIIRACLDSYVRTSSSKKDTMERQVRNAVTALAEADRQVNHAIGLALSVTAIEALLGQRGTELAREISDRVAVLLEPELDHRGAAVEYMKRIYDDRSRVLHGDNFDHLERRRGEVRLLAAGVLYAFVDCKKFLQRWDKDPETPEVLLKELRQGRFNQGIPIGIREMPRVWNLWRARSSVEQ